MTDAYMPIFDWLGHGRPGHRPLAVCPGCGLDVKAVGLPSIVYTFESCDCPEWTKRHLVEQLWHRDCFTDREDSDD